MLPGVCGLRLLPSRKTIKANGSKIKREIAIGSQGHAPDPPGMRLVRCMGIPVLTFLILKPTDAFFPWPNRSLENYDVGENSPGKA